MSKVIQLSEIDKKNKKYRIKTLEFENENDEIQLFDCEKRLDSGINTRMAEETLKKMEEQLKSGKASDGTDLTDLEKEELKIQIETHKEWLKRDMPSKSLRNEINKRRLSIEQRNEHQIKPLKSQLRAGNVKV